MLHGRTAGTSASDWPHDDVWHDQRGAALGMRLVGGGPKLRVISSEEPGDDVSFARSLLDRDDLLQTLDRAVDKRVTVISAPAGSGKTSLLRAWVDRSTDDRHVAFVSVERDQQSAHRFWGAVLEAIRLSAGSTDP